MANPFDANQFLNSLHDLHADPTVTDDQDYVEALAALDYDQLAAVAQLTSPEPIDPLLNGDDLIEQISAYLDSE